MKLQTAGIIAFILLFIIIGLGAVNYRQREYIEFLEAYSGYWHRHHDSLRHQNDSLQQRVYDLKDSLITLKYETPSHD